MDGLYSSSHRTINSIKPAPSKPTLIHTYTHELLMHVYASMCRYIYVYMCVRSSYMSQMLASAWVHNMLSGQVTA